jgi:hypothetical protein
MSSTAKKSDGKKNVVIVGAGAAGMSCAASLARYPDKFNVTVIERLPYCGGQATSIALDQEKFGTSWMNDGVQGGTPAFKHTGRFLESQGHPWQHVKLQVGFGKGPDNFWTNVFPTPLVVKHQKDIKKFGRVLKIIKYTMPVLGLVPIKYMLKLFWFSKDFSDKMVIPLIALFLGTGNQTPNVACAVLERLFQDPNMRLWDYDENMLLPNLPEMVTFPKLHDFYEDWKKDLESKGVRIRLNTDVTEILSRKGESVTLRTRPFDSSLNDHSGEFAPQVIHETHGDWTGPAGEPESYDKMVLCTLADDALKILGKAATWKERFVLGGAAFFNDITITHWDSEYFDKIYEPHFNSELAAKPRSEQEENHLKFAKAEIDKNDDGEPSGYRPMYFTTSYSEAPQKIEMSFDCTRYQHQFRMDHGKELPPVPYDRHVFQSIFLDENNKSMWTMDKIDPDKVIESKWWHQLGHRWQHYVRVVPNMMWINGKNNTYFAAAWTLVNMHEIACVSGLAAAHRLGAEYEVFDDFAEDLFKKYLMLLHGVRYRGAKAKST